MQYQDKIPRILTAEQDEDDDDDDSLLQQAFERLPAGDQAVIRSQLAHGGLTLREWFARRLAERWPTANRLH